MPVIVIGADTTQGQSIVEALAGRDGEVRAFVTDVAAAERMRGLGVKVAVGDVTDGSHIEGAALGAYTAVLIPEAAHDDRERSFSPTPAATFALWASSLSDAGVSRLLWVDDGSDEGWAERIGSRFGEWAGVTTSGRSPEDVAREVASLDDAASLETS